MIQRITKLALIAIVLCACLLLAEGPAPAEAPSCPPPRHYSGGCIQVIVWATNPQTGVCCQYPDPCSAPQGWTISYSGCASES